MSNFDRFNKFLKKAKDVHGDAYDYSKANYVDYHTKIIIICPIHGEFEQLPLVHVNQKSGCRLCGTGGTSLIAAEWLDSFNNPILKKEHSIYLHDGTRIRVDGYDPETNTVYEFLGDWWHGNPKSYNSNSFHPVIKRKYGRLYEDTLTRNDKIIKSGFDLITIWENEWISTMDINPSNRKYTVGRKTIRRKTQMHLDREKSKKRKIISKDKEVKPKREVIGPFDIYKITNLTTNEGYIGYAKNAQDRIREHFNQCKKNGSRLLRTAIALFGREHFTSAIIDRADTEEEAKRLKNHYISMFRTMMPYGFNHRIKGHFEWSDTQKDKIRGSKNHTSKLTEEQVIMIYKDKRKQKVLAKEYGVSTATISKIKRKLIWRHLFG